MRDRWHNCLKDLDEGKEVDPDDVKMKVCLPITHNYPQIID